MTCEIVCKAMYVPILPACSVCPCIYAGFPYSMLGLFAGKVRKRGCAITHDLNIVFFDNRCVSSSSYVPQTHGSVKFSVREDASNALNSCFKVAWKFTDPCV